MFCALLNISFFWDTKFCHEVWDILFYGVFLQGSKGKLAKCGGGKTLTQAAWRIHSIHTSLSMPGITPQTDCWVTTPLRTLLGGFLHSSLTYITIPPPLFAKVMWKNPMCISMSTLCELILLSTNCLVSPKDTEAMVGWCPNSGSPSVCHETWSFLSRYKLHNTELSVKLICFSTLVLTLCKEGGHCGWIIENHFWEKT